MEEAATETEEKAMARPANSGGRPDIAHGSQRRQLWRQFFLLRDSFARVGPAAVLTVHRSQGSSFTDVFVAPDVYWPQQEEIRRQLY